MQKLTLTPAQGNIISQLEPLLLAQGWQIAFEWAFNDKCYISAGTSGTEGICINIIDYTNGATNITAGLNWVPGAEWMQYDCGDRNFFRSATLNSPCYAIVTPDYITLAVKTYNTNCMFNVVHAGLLNRYDQLDKNAIVLIGADSTITTPPNSYPNWTIGNTFASTGAKVVGNSLSQMNLARGLLSLNATLDCEDFPNPEGGGAILSSILVGKTAGEINGTLNGILSAANCPALNEDIYLINGINYRCFNLAGTIIAIKEE